MSSDGQAGKAFIVLWMFCLVLGGVLQLRWLIATGVCGLAFWWIEYSVRPTLGKRWRELLAAIRGRQRSSSYELEWEQQHQEYRQQLEYDHQIEVTHQKTQYKHIPGLPWGDPGAYVAAPDDPEQALKDLLERNVKKRQHDAERSRRGTQEARCREA